MEKSHYLPIGHKVGGHYEIVKVLGEDDFEILYLAKDLHLLEKPFVLKELFLKAYSSRENVNVYTLAKSKSLFEETKKEVIAEISVLQKEASSHVAQVYGYFEENDTVYTIVEFREKDSVHNYLHLNPIDEKQEEKKEKAQPKKIIPKKPTLFEKKPKNPEKGEKKEKSTIFLKILIVVSLLLLALAYYSYNMIQEDKERIKNRAKLSVVQETVVHHPPLEDKQNKKREEPIDTSNQEEKEIIPRIPEKKKEKAKPKKSIEDLIDISSEEFEEEERKEAKEREVPNSLIVKENISLGTLIGGERKDVFTRASIENFLNAFMASSTNGTLDDVVANYDSKVDRYFSLRNITPAKVRQDKVRYQRKWTHRDFVLANFKIINIYHKDNFDYCDVETTTYWNVATNSYKTASGTSRGFMTLKNTANGFKVTAIYTLAR